MKKTVCWIVAAAALMLGAPWLAVKFAGMNAMAICFLLFYVANPLFFIACGLYAGTDVRRLWALPLLAAALFLAGAWSFFEAGEPAFWLYAGCYLPLGLVPMAVRALLRRR